MIALLLAFVGSEEVAVVTVDGSDLVAELRGVIAEKQKFSFPVYGLKLYTTYRDERWLTSQDTSLKDLQQPTFARDSPYLAVEMNPIFAVSRYFPAKTLKPDAIHVLALIPTVGTTRSIAQLEAEDVTLLSPPLKRPALIFAWVRSSTPCPQLRVDDSLFLSIPWHYLEYSGLDAAETGHDLCLYRRAALREQWNELERDCIDAEAHLYIVGPPGAGKSCAACGLVDRTRWNILWIHYDKRTNHLTCVKLEGDVKATCRLYSPSLSFEDLETQLVSLITHRDLIVFLDGYRKDDEGCELVRSVLVFWYHQGSAHRRFVCVTSMPSTRYNSSKHDRLEATPTNLHG